MSTNIYNVLYVNTPFCYFIYYHILPAPLLGQCVAFCSVENIQYIVVFIHFLITSFCGFLGLDHSHVIFKLMKPVSKFSHFVYFYDKKIKVFEIKEIKHLLFCCNFRWLKVKSQSKIERQICTEENTHSYIDDSAIIIQVNTGRIKSN